MRDQAGENAATTTRPDEATLLLVDDDDLIPGAIGRTLRTLGHTVLEASGPAEALAISGDTLSTVDALVTDVMMPGMDGGTMAAHLRDRRPDLPVLFISGYAHDPIGGREKVPGAGFLAKPFTRDEVRAAIRSVLGGGGGRTSGLASG